jgi:hypothetical protein
MQQKNMERGSFQHGNWLLYANIEQALKGKQLLANKQLR